MYFTTVPVRWAALLVKQIIIAHFYIIITHYNTIITAIISCCSSLLRNKRIIIAYYYIHHDYYTIFKYYYVCYHITFTCYSCNNEPIITVIMDPLLSIFTRFLMGNNGFIITHCEPGQLADEVSIEGYFKLWACHGSAYAAAVTRAPSVGICNLRLVASPPGPSSSHILSDFISSPRFSFRA